MKIPPLIPLSKATQVPQRNPGYDPFLDEIMDLRLPPKQWYMTRWQMLLVGCGIQPDRYDYTNRCYIPTHD